MLIIANLFGAMSICISGVFSAVKDTKTLATTTVMGGIANIILNALLIPFLSVQGAVIATMISTSIVWIWRMYKVRFYIRLNIHLARDTISYVLVFIQCIVGLSKNHLYVVQLVILMCVIALYGTELKSMCRFAIRRLRKDNIKS